MATKIQWSVNIRSKEAEEPKTDDEKIKALAPKTAIAVPKLDRVVKTRIKESTKQVKPASRVACSEKDTNQNIAPKKKSPHSGIVFKAKPTKASAIKPFKFGTTSKKISKTENMQAVQSQESEPTGNNQNKDNKFFIKSKSTSCVLGKATENTKNVLSEMRSDLIKNVDVDGKTSITQKKYSTYSGIVFKAKAPALKPFNLGATSKTVNKTENTQAVQSEVSEPIVEESKEGMKINKNAKPISGVTGIAKEHTTEKILPKGRSDLIKNPHINNKVPVTEKITTGKKSSARYSGIPLKKISNLPTKKHVNMDAQSKGVKSCERSKTESEITLDKSFKMCETPTGTLKRSTVNQIRLNDEYGIKCSTPLPGQSKIISPDFFLPPFLENVPLDESVMPKMYTSHTGLRFVPKTRKSLQAFNISTKIESPGTPECSATDNGIKSSSMEEKLE